MKLLVTGAGGFIGSWVIADAVRRGHQVRALVRPSRDAGLSGWDNDPQVEVMLCDLRSRKGLDEACLGVDAVIHLAAAKQGGFYDQFDNTVAATENLLSAMDSADVKRIVLLSSFTVYAASAPDRTMDENFPLEAQPDARDAYTSTKLLQEAVVRNAIVGLSETTAMILRAGVVFGPNNLWSARLGLQVTSSVWLCAGPTTLLPVVYVENCSAAIVTAAEIAVEPGLLVFNVVDDNPPTKRQYVRALAVRTRPRPRVVWLPWWMVSAIGALATIMNRVAFRGEARLPGLLKPAVISSRMRPRQYPNDRLRHALGNVLQVSLDDALDRSTT